MGWRIKGKGRTVALWRQILWRRVDFWNLGALQGHTQQKFPGICTGRVGIYMTHGEAGRTTEQSRAKSRSVVKSI